MLTSFFKKTSSVSLIETLRFVGSYMILWSNRSSSYDRSNPLKNTKATLQGFETNSVHTSASECARAVVSIQDRDQRGGRERYFKGLRLHTSCTHLYDICFIQFLDGGRWVIGCYNKSRCKNVENHCVGSSRNGSQVADFCLVSFQ